jgi:hypothetical protein
MAAARCNYLVTYENSPQVYSSSTLQTIIKGSPPKNCTDEGRSILFITYFPDDKEMRVYKVTDEEIAAEVQKLEEKEKAKLEQETDETAS